MIFYNIDIQNIKKSITFIIYIFYYLVKKCYVTIYFLNNLINKNNIKLLLFAYIVFNIYIKLSNY